LNAPDLLVDFRVVLRTRVFGRQLGVRAWARSNLAWSRIIGIERNSNIVARAKAGGVRSLGGDIGVEERLECDEIGRPLSL